MTEFIVAGEIVKIHQYLMKAPRLRYMAGGSILIEAFSTSLAPALAKKFEPGAEIYLAAAGRFMAGFTDRSKAQAFADTIRFAGNQLFGDGVSLVCEPSDAGTGVIKDVADKLDQMKVTARNRPVSAMAGLQYMRRCDECGAWGAENTITEGDKTGAVCRQCYHKHQARNGKKIRINTTDGMPVVFCKKGEDVSEDCVKACYPENLYYQDTLKSRDKLKSFPDIAEESDPPYIGVFYADGNEMGTLISGCNDLDAYRAFSSRIGESNNKALSEAVNAALDEKKKFNGLILIKGGDDLLAVLPADKAVDFALAFMGKAAENNSPLKKGICGGLVFAPANMPFTRLYDLADDLCTSAKNKIWFLKKGKEQSFPAPSSQSALDFMLITSSLVPELGDMRERQTVQKQDNVYTLFSARPYRLTEFRSLVEKVRKVKKLEPPLPRRAYMDFKEIFRPGDLKDNGRTDAKGEFLEFDAFVKRLKALYGKNKKAMQDFFETGILDPEFWKTRDAGGAPYDAKRVWQADIVELVDFINAGGGQTP